MGQSIRALVNTVAKKEPIDSLHLEGNRKTNILAGWVCPILDSQGAENNHVKVNLGFNAGIWYFYKPHIQLYGSMHASGTLAEKVVACCEERDFPLDREPGEINIIGIEGMHPNGEFNLDQNDKWNDTVAILTFREGKPHFNLLCKATTEPGYHYTHNTEIHEGVARLDTGYHHNLWQVGQHRGYEALAQKGNLARLVRDANRDYLRNDTTSYERLRGINLHTTKPGLASPDTIGKWSAGCVVIYSPKEFLQFMELVKGSSQFRRYSDFAFSFILIWSRWLEQTPRPIEPVPTVSDDYDVDIDVLARTIWGEARGEKRLGKTAVAWVVRNRASRSPSYGWPPTIRQVCQQPWQFSCWNENDPNRDKLLTVNVSNSEFRESQEIAKKVLNGEIPDPTNGADHFFANYISTPDWARGQSIVAEIGVHLFYRLV
ncbi:cell Wall hydrolase [Rubidibacter lacunae KORDI 51-2]|uniref:Cell Wall hydrolase n=1 Tax=Rubidibacter lacunae KORDI 51-2 TaxID=582515 RepID=U5DNF2_9CHRO|nr:cell wall hydrolase [Rubidibacter lacunae]ERN43196.1 cell Wall hydrolase [Rubidibacter lacunae KORDI 51-2]